MAVIKASTIQSKIPIPIEDPTKYIDLLIKLIDEYFDLQKTKNVEETKRFKIEKQTESTLRKLEFLEKTSLQLIEKNYKLRERILEEIIVKFRESNEPTIIQLCLQALISTLNTNSLSEEIKNIYAKLENDKEIEI